MLFEFILFRFPTQMTSLKLRAFQHLHLMTSIRGCKRDRQHLADALSRLRLLRQSLCRMRSALKHRMKLKLHFVIQNQLQEEEEIRMERVAKKYGNR